MKTPERVDGFFTDRTASSSKSIEIEEKNQTEKWIDELDDLNEQDFQMRTKIPLGMSRDSLNATAPGTLPIEQTSERRLPTVFSFDEQSKVYDQEAEDATKKIQRWYRQQRDRQNYREIDDAA